MTPSHCFVNLTPLSFLERCGRFHSEQPAVILPDGAVSFGELLSRTRRMAGLLRGLGVATGDRVGLLSHNSLQSIEAHYAIPAAGAIIVAFNPWLPPADIAKQLAYSGARALLVSTTTYQQFRDILQPAPAGCSLVLLDAEPGASYPGTGLIDFEAEQHGLAADVPLDCWVQDENAPIAINFTSGTTGDPKGVMYSHRAAYLHALGQVMMLGLDRQSTYFWSLPMFHVNGWGHMWAAVAAGARQVVDLDCAGLSYEHLAQRVAAVGASHMAGAPRIMRHLIAPGMPALKGLRVLTGGAAPTPELVKSALGLGIELIHQYGLSETFGPFVVCEPRLEWQAAGLDEQVAKRLRQGIPAVHAGAGLRVVDEALNEVPWDGSTLGEVLMAGNSLALGYFNNPEASAKAFKNGWFHSGDMAVVHADGYLELKDRIKDIIYVETAYGWENISSIEIEQVVGQFPGIQDVAVIGTRGQSPVIVAFYERKTGHDIDCDALGAFCTQALPSFKVPAHFFECALPKTATGKVRKNLLEAQLAERLAGGAGRSALGV